MKNKKLRPWIVNLLIIINFLSVCLLCGECDNFVLFIIKMIACLIIFIFNSYMLYFYGGLENGNIR